MQLRTPNVTPLVGVLFVVFAAVSTDLRMLTVDVPRGIDGGSCGPPEDHSHELFVALRPDLSAAIQSVAGAVETEPAGFALALRSAVAASAPHDAPAQQFVINVEPDEEVRWGDLVSTFDTMRGVAPDAHIALVPHAEAVVEGW